MKTQSSAYADFLFYRRSFSLILAAFLLTTSAWAGSSCDQLFSSEKKTTENFLRPNTVLETDREPIGILHKKETRYLLEWDSKNLHLRIRPMQDLEKTFSGFKIKFLDLIKQSQAFSLSPEAQADLKKITAASFDRLVNEVQWSVRGAEQVDMILDTDHFSYIFKLDFRNYLLRNDPQIVVHIDFMPNEYLETKQESTVVHFDFKEKKILKIQETGKESINEAPELSEEEKRSLHSLRLPFKNSSFTFYDFENINRRLILGSDPLGQQGYLSLLPLDIARNENLYLLPSQFVYMDKTHPLNSELLEMFCYQDQVILVLKTKTHIEIRVSDFKTKVPSSKVFTLDYKDKHHQVFFSGYEYDGKEVPPFMLLGLESTTIGFLTQDVFHSWGAAIYDINQKNFYLSSGSIRQNPEEIPLKMKVYSMQEVAQDQFAIFLESHIPSEDRYVRRWIIMKP